MNNISEKYAHSLDNLKNVPPLDEASLKARICERESRKLPKTVRRNNFLRVLSVAGSAAACICVMLAVFAFIRFVGPESTVPGGNINQDNLIIPQVFFMGQEPPDIFDSSPLVLIYSSDEDSFYDFSFNPDTRLLRFTFQNVLDKEVSLGTEYNVGADYFGIIPLTKPVNYVSFQMRNAIYEDPLSSVHEYGSEKKIPAGGKFNFVVALDDLGFPGTVCGQYLIVVNIDGEYHEIIFRYPPEHYSVINGCLSFSPVVGEDGILTGTSRQYFTAPAESEKFTPTVNDVVYLVYRTYSFKYSRFNYQDEMPDPEKNHVVVFDYADITDFIKEAADALFRDNVKTSDGGYSFVDRNGKTAGIFYVGKPFRIVSDGKETVLFEDSFFGSTVLIPESEEK